MLLDSPDLNVGRQQWGRDKLSSGHDESVAATAVLCWLLNAEHLSSVLGGTFPILYVCTCLCVGAHMCVRCLPQTLSTLVFEAWFLINLKLANSSKIYMNSRQTVSAYIVLRPQAWTTVPDWFFLTWVLGY